MSETEKSRQRFKVANARAEVTRLSNQLSMLTPGTKPYTSKLNELTYARHVLLEAANKLKDMK